MPPPRHKHWPPPQHHGASGPILCHTVHARLFPCTFEAQHVVLVLGVHGCGAGKSGKWPSLSRCPAACPIEWLSGISCFVFTSAASLGSRPNTFYRDFFFFLVGGYISSIVAFNNIIRQHVWDFRRLYNNLYWNHYPFVNKSFPLMLYPISIINYCLYRTYIMRRNWLVVVSLFLFQLKFCTEP